MFEFKHILYADTDIFFRHSLETFASTLTLPKDIQLGFEAQPIFPYNAGVYLASLPFLRSTHRGFVADALRDRSLLDPKYGPGDQGAVNQY